MYHIAAMPVTIYYLLFIVAVHVFLSLLKCVKSVLFSIYTAGDVAITASVHVAKITQMANMGSYAFQVNDVSFFCGFTIIPFRIPAWRRRSLRFIDAQCTDMAVSD